MNSHIQYFYRDGANDKAYPDEPVIVAGELPEDAIRACLRSGEQFIPGDVGLPELQTQLEGFPSRDDHVWHELHAIEPTARRRPGFNPFEPTSCMPVS